jgi:hypothetical protein
MQSAGWASPAAYVLATLTHEEQSDLYYRYCRGNPEWRGKSALEAIDHMNATGAHTGIIRSMLEQHPELGADEPLTSIIVRTTLAQHGTVHRDDVVETLQRLKGIAPARL